MKKYDLFLFCLLLIISSSETRAMDELYFSSEFHIDHHADGSTTKQLLWGAGEISRIVAIGNVDLWLSQADNEDDQEYVLITAETKLIDKVDLFFDDSKTLVVGFAVGNGLMPSVCTIKIKNISDILIEDTVKVQCLTPIRSQRFTLRCFGDASFRCNDIKAKELYADVRDMGVVNCKGEVAKQRIFLFNKAHYNAKELLAFETIVKTLDRSKADVSSTHRDSSCGRIAGSISGVLRGRSELYYKGNPIIKNLTVGSFARSVHVKEGFDVNVYALCMRNSS